MKNHTRQPIESLACVESDCDLYGQAGQGNLTVRKVYGKDSIRYLRCTCCGREFSERKGSALWNTKVSEAKAVSVAEHLSEGCSQESTARLVNVDISVVQRLNGVIGKHGRLFHEERVKDVAYRPSRKGTCGRQPNIRYRIPRTLAHVQIIKRREGACVIEVDVRHTHGSRKRAAQALDALGYRSRV